MFSVNHLLSTPGTEVHQVGLSCKGGTTNLKVEGGGGVNALEGEGVNTVKHYNLKNYMGGAPCMPPSPSPMVVPPRPPMAPQLVWKFTKYGAVIIIIIIILRGLKAL